MKCDWKQIGDRRFRCTRCGRLAVVPSGHPIPPDFNKMPDCGGSTPSLKRRVWNYAAAINRWRKAGMPTRTKEEINFLLTTFCSQCDSYDSTNHTCKVCGCRVTKNTFALVNKLAMATEGCPLHKFHGISGLSIQMNDLHNFFERVYVINLRRRIDRLKLFRDRLSKYGWPFKEPIVYPAIEGDVVGVPPEFSQGGGAYGCRMSHLRILQDCLMDGVSSVLILEDDADIGEGFTEKVKEFLEKVPDDWEGIMLGGQHHAPPINVGIPGVVRVRYCQRTHAYAARPEYMKALQRRWGNASVHIDWLMRDWQHQHIVYAPDLWLIGQAGGRSDIRGAEKLPEWWVHGSFSAVPGPVAVAFVDRLLVEQLWKIGFHGGMRKDNNGVDVGLQQILGGDHSDQDKQRALRQWLQMIQSESVAGLLPTVWHPKATLEMVKAAWDGPVYAVRGNSVEEVLSCLPEDLKNKMKANQTLRTSPMILLRCPPDMIEGLLSHGFHPGYWRDGQRKYDVGLIRIMEKMEEGQRLEELKEWCKLLCQQADKEGLIVAAVHPELTAEMLMKATDRKVIEIEASSYDELNKKLISI